MKILITNTSYCGDCPCCRKEESCWGGIVEAVCQAKENRDVLVYLDGVSGFPSWCPSNHPLKAVSNDFYLYDRKYLMDHLDREIRLLKAVKRFEEKKEKQ